jgi:hypothetical protein
VCFAKLSPKKFVVQVEALERLLGSRRRYSIMRGTCQIRYVAMMRMLKSNRRRTIGVIARF